MKRCPTCNRTYADVSLNFCLDDGTPLVMEGAPTADLNATVRYPTPRDTAEPPPTEIYRPAPPPPSPRPTAPPPPPPQQWTPPPTVAPRKRSNAIWWVLGGFAVVLIIGAGVVAVFIALSLSSNSNSTVNTNTRETNRNANANANANANVANANANANANAGPPASLVDDFSENKWGTGVSAFGRTWYTNGEYHMSSKERTFVVIYAPSNDYSTENATVKVTARSVDGSVPSAGFGLMVHGVQPKPGQLEDYALLIYPSTEPEYEIIMHKQGAQSTLVERTKSSAIRSGSTTNQLEIRIKGTELSFYVNGQFLKTIADRENFRNGRAGFYTSDVTEVAFDDLHIDRSR
jgi:eukaryotic-like serine/threonine-protein kinase